MARFHQRSNAEKGSLVDGFACEHCQTARKCTASCHVDGNMNLQSLMEVVGMMGTESQGQMGMNLKLNDDMMVTEGRTAFVHNFVDQSCKVHSRAFQSRMMIGRIVAAGKDHTIDMMGMKGQPNIEPKSFGGTGVLMEFLGRMGKIE